ncbi:MULTISPECIES: AraC family transcriptional regulator [unclassified Rathayibacter]|uniref:AraC family transcriptional regulator n=1 Tax=unclassified Rathayibacter TaxID=2609250 RepID=UPI0010476610|nr:MULTISPECIES: AraC family transcriptional regulator [unclassified Rathayibacter]TCL82614.1 AraC family transcriptional regulator [Rathayibacter sp. PhB192]TCM27953.1 AraC family transcriptional regulator [Rathayibacter sp. PhB179]
MSDAAEGPLGPVPGWTGVAVREVVDPHDHEVTAPATDALQLILVTAGSYLIESARPHGRWAHGHAAPGRSAATAPGREIRAAWRSRSSETFRSLHVTVAAPLVAGVLEGVRGASVDRLDFLAVGEDFVRSAMLELARAARAGAPPVLADAVGTALVAHLLSLPEPTAAPAGLSRAQLALVTDHLAARLADPVTLDELAALVHLSPFHFLRRFSASTGSTPMRYLTALRMEHGRELLRRTDTPVAAIAAACGYATPAAFAAAYRRHHGASPREHRPPR